MVSVNPSTSFRSGSSLSDFQALQRIAKKEFGLQSVIFRDDLDTAKDVMTVLSDLKQRGYDLSDISLMVSEEATKKCSRFILGMQKGDTPEIINHTFQALKHLLPADLQKTTQTDLQKRLLETLIVGGHTIPTTVGKVQKPLLIINPNYRQIPRTTLSTDNPQHIIYHEAGHTLHVKHVFKLPPIDRSLNEVQRRSTLNLLYGKLEASGLEPYMKSPEDPNPLIKLGETITKEVSPQGGKRPLEFVAEYFVKKLFDPSYTNTELDKFYTRMQGPASLPKK